MTPVQPSTAPSSEILEAITPSGPSCGYQRIVWWRVLVQVGSNLLSDKLRIYSKICKGFDLSWST
jgi:hypothetical protein